MRRGRVIVALCGVALVCVAAAITPAFAASHDSDGSKHVDRRISLSGDVEVARGEVVDGPVATVDGDAHIRGTVRDYVVVGEGDVFVSGRVTEGVVVVHGNAHISGRVGGDVVALTGRVTVTDSGSVGGDVVSRRDPSIAPGTVDGEVRSVDLRAIATGVILGFLAYLWLATTITTAIVGVVFVGLLPVAADTAVAAGKRVKASIGWGALIGIVGPFIGILLFVSLLGTPLGLTMLAGLNVLAPLGYVTVALMLGRVWFKGVSNRARLGAFFAGFGILRLVALIPGLGLIVWILVCLYGIGAVSMAAWYGGHLVRPPPDAELPPPPPPDDAPDDAPDDRPDEAPTEPAPVA